MATIPSDDLLTNLSPTPSRPSLAVWISVVALLTLVAVASGSAMGLLLAGKLTKGSQLAAETTSRLSDSTYGGDADLRELPPVITNLADPEGTWVRVQASIVYDRKQVAKPDVIASQISEDILGFMRTLSMAQIGGASGLQHLREDLNERAVIRSGGLVHELIVHSVVFQ